MGPSSSAITVMVKAFSTYNPSWSVLRTLIEQLLWVSKSKVPDVRRLSPVMLNEALSVSPVPVTNV